MWADLGTFKKDQWPEYVTVTWAQVQQWAEHISVTWAHAQRVPEHTPLVSTHNSDQKHTICSVNWMHSNDQNTQHAVFQMCKIKSDLSTQQWSEQASLTWTCISDLNTKKISEYSSAGQIIVTIMLKIKCSQDVDVVEVLLYIHRNCRLIMDGSPGWPPGLSHISWALM